MLKKKDGKFNEVCGRGRNTHWKTKKEKKTQFKTKRSSFSSCFVFFFLHELLEETTVPPNQRFRTE